MKLGKLITGFILSTLLAVGVGVGIGSARNEAKGAEAAGETWFVRGIGGNWDAPDSRKLIEGKASLLLNVASNSEFKVANSGWTDQIVSANGNAINNGVTWNNYDNSNIVTGNYSFKVSGRTVTIDKWTTAYFSSGDTIYIRPNDNFKQASATCYISIGNTDATTTVAKLTTSVTTKGNENLFEYTFTKDAYYFELDRRNSDGSTSWNFSTNKISSHSSNLFNADLGSTLVINEQSASIVNVTLIQPANGSIAVKNAYGDESGAGYYYSSWSLQFTATPSSAEYYFGNWTDGSGTDWEGDDKYRNPVTLTNLSGTFSVSCKFKSYADKDFKILGSTTGTWTAQTQDISIALSYQTGSASTDDGATYYSTSVALTAGSVFKPVNLTNNIYYAYSTLEEGEHSAKGVYVADDGTKDHNIKVLTSGTYEIYVKTGTGTVWMQISSIDEANGYAEEFLSTIVCNEGGGTNFNINLWNKVGEATTSMEYKYEHLTEGARNLLTGATANKDSSKAYERCVARYDRILGKYGYGSSSDKYHDFMGRTPAPQGSALRLSILNNTKATSTAVIVIVSSLATVAAFAGYFFYKKKKED